MTSEQQIRADERASMGAMLRDYAEIVEIGHPDVAVGVRSSADRILAAETVRAIAAGKVGSDGSRHGSVDGHRAMVGISPQARRRCACCGSRATHVGLGDGLALMDGCEVSVRRWVRDGYPETDRAETRDV